MSPFSADGAHRPSASSLPALPPGHVPRPRLATALDADVRIVCVVAAAGWGKTVVLRELGDAGAAPVLWIGLDAEPCTAAEFWHAVLRAVTDLAPDDDEVRNALRATAAEIAGGSVASRPDDAWFARDLADLVAEVLCRLPPTEEGEPCTIVVDDLHRLEHDALGAWWAFVERISGDVRVAMASRHVGSFPLSAWRLRDDVHVVDESDLAFDAAETAAAVLALTGRFTDEVVARIGERTEGWPAAVLHQVRALRGDDVAPPAGAGTDETLELMHHVLGGLDPDVREFLSDVSVLAELTIESCHALSGRSDAGALLRDVARSGILTGPLDAEADTSRIRRPYHELLRTELNRDHPERWETLHRRAADHHLERAAVGTAASHLVDIGDHRGALSLLLKHHATVMEMAQHLELAPLLERVPIPAVRSDARRTFALGFLLASSGHIAAGRRVVETLLDTELDPDLQQRVRWVRLIVACSLGDVGDDDLEHPPKDPPDRAITTFWRELPIALVLDDRLATADEVWADGVRWGVPAATDALLQATTEIFLGAWRGRIRDVIPDTTEAEEDLIDARNRPRAAYVRIAITRAMIDTELGDPMEAVRRLEHAAVEFDGRVIPYTTHDVPLFRTIVRALRLAGRADLALARGLEFERAIDRSRPRLRRLISEEVVRAACAVGDLETANRERRELTGPCSLPLADAWIAIAQGDPRSARSAVAGLDVTELTVRAPSRALDLLEVRARAALTVRERDDLVAAAARLAEEHGLVRSFERGIGTIDAAARRTVEPNAAPLSDRELVVLRGLASGVSHRVLAAALDVSHNTLKTHLRAVYRKLGALDRDDAVLRARTAGLLSSPSADPAAH